MGHQLFTFLFLTSICIPGIYALALVTPNNPVEVGSNVTISLSDPANITVGSWLIESGTLFLWVGQDVYLGSGNQPGIEFNITTYQLTLLSVTLNSSGTYILESFRKNNTSTKAVITLEVQERVSNVTADISADKTNLVEFNDTVTLTCTARGTALHFSWQNGSSTVTAGERVQLSNGGRNLIISNVTRYDEGPFKCVVVNNISSGESTQMNLTISYGPSNLRITASPDNTTFASGSTISLSCSAESKPTASFYWTHNDNPLNVHSSTFNITDATENKTGPYTCVAHNPVTFRYAAVTKDIRIVDPISAVVVNPVGTPVEHMPFNLTCNVVGPVDSIQWMKNGMHLYANDTITFSNGNSTLSFNKLAISDDGPYQCAASNAVSHRSSQAYNLTVNYGPINTIASGPGVAKAGSAVTFNCSSVSYPQSQYSWYFSGSKVAEDSMYVTAALRKNDSGQYTCMAFNSITGLSSNSSVHLTVLDPVSAVVVNAGNQQPIFNQPFTLTCIVSGDVEHIHWMKNYMFLHPTNGITFSSDNTTLTFQNLSLHDDGHYQCEASNAVSNSTSPAYDLMVNYGPWNQTVEGPIIAEIGFNVTFNCTADSRPQSQYSWFHNSSKVGDGPVYVTAVLSLNDSGQYTCMAFNNITGHSSNASVQLTVIDPITVVVIPDRLIPLASQSLQLKCNVTGPYNKIHWLRNNLNFQPSGGVIFSGDNTTVTFNYLKTADDGQYQCVATNLLKEHVSQPYGLAAVFGPQSVQIIVHPGIPTKLTCQALSQPPAVFYWLANNTLVGNQSTVEVPIKNILGSNYTCVAKNPLTNVTVYTSQVVNNPNAAVGIQASVLLTALIALLLPVLELWL
ncbi:hypothetical protein R3I93_008910 [Phoxinus phoxinus]|uniref:Ig-like domain-containing protein n=1 Tax=Phoxinus phoxinus TaxID=58324 RepID=A0AAN9D623_9TELE